MKRIFITLFLIPALLLFAGCTVSDDGIQNIKATSTVFASYECTVTVESIDPLLGGERAVFKPTISADDITLSHSLEGKTVKSVRFIDKYNIELLLDGVCSATTQEDFGMITVSRRALENKSDAFTVVNVEKAHISANSSMSASASGTYTAVYTLPIGSFTDKANSDHIRIADGSDGVIEEIFLEDGKLTITVKGATSCPTIEMDAEVTSFNKVITVKVTSPVRVDLE